MYEAGFLHIDGSFCGRRLVRNRDRYMGFLTLNYQLGLIGLIER